MKDKRAVPQFSLLKSISHYFHSSWSGLALFGVVFIRFGSGVYSGVHSLYNIVQVQDDIPKG